MSLLLAIAGAVAPVPDDVQQGGIGHGKKAKRVYLERDGKILLFAKPTHAAAWIAAEKAIERSKASEVEIDTQLPVNAPKQRVEPIHQPEQVVQVDVLAQLMAQFRFREDFSKMIERQEYAAMFSLYRKAMQRRDEDDIELLLLAA